jgi:hypothetical protein
MVLEPNQVVLTGATGNFLTQGNPAAKALEILSAILLVSNPGGGANDSVPDQLIIAALNMGIDMGNVAATATVGQECNTWDTGVGSGDVGTGVLATNTAGACTSLQTTNCAITSKANGLLTVDFGAADDCTYGVWVGAETQTGGLNVYGEIRTAVYPGYRPSVTTPDCSAGGIDCRDVWVTATSGNWGSGADALTYPSAISGYVFNYDLNNSVPLQNLPLFIVANLQINSSNVAAIFGMPAGLSGVATDYFGGIVDGTGLIWGYALGDSGPGNGSRIIIATLPIQSDGSLCNSVYDAASVSETATDFVLNVGASDSCGL